LTSSSIDSPARWSSSISVSMVSIGIIPRTIKGFLFQYSSKNSFVVGSVSRIRDMGANLFISKRRLVNGKEGRVK
jgi:hypothetical protein